VRIDVEDNAGAYEESERAKDGLGLQIVEKRLRSVVGAASRLEIYCVPNELTRITFRMPLNPLGSPWPH
jgi:two-component system LytT family sensor kinase